MTRLIDYLSILKLETLYKTETFHPCITLALQDTDFKMTTELKLNNGAGMQNPKPNGNTLHAVDATLSGRTVKNTFDKHPLKKKYYKSLFDYCSEVAEELPERQAFYAADFEDILWKVQEWKKCLPNVEIFYAVKANTYPILLQLLTKLGLSFDCASMGEIKMVLEAGASPQNIIFAHTIKTAEELKFASDRGVELMTFDNEDELLKIHRSYPNAKLLIRISPKIVSCVRTLDLSEKFGCTEDVAVKLLKLAHKLNLNVVGVSFHVGSLCTDPISYVSTIETSRRLFDAAKDIGFNFTILDIGGGFFGASETQQIFYKMAEGINGALKKHFSDIQVRIIAEPGTYIVESAFQLICTVLGRRCFDNNAVGRSKRHYFLNDSIYGSFSRQIFLHSDESPIPLMAESEAQSRPKYESRLYGQSCSAVDVITDSVVLPDLKIGERILWSNKGAYFQGVSSTFCGIPVPVSRCSFVNKQRLNMDWIPVQGTIADFLKKHVCFIGCAEDVI